MHNIGDVTENELQHIYLHENSSFPAITVHMLIQELLYGIMVLLLKVHILNYFHFIS